jgi:putative transposase
MSASDKPHAERLRTGRISAPGETYFITKCVDERRPILADARAAEEVISSLAHVRQEGQIKLLAFVIMPDHYHAVFTLLTDEKLEHLMQRIGSFTANKIRKLLGVRGVIWQDGGFHDHRCRDEEDVLGCAAYVEHNPVRKGWVTDPADWLLSSAHPTRKALLDWDWWAGG